MHPEKGPAVEHTAGPEECGLFVAGEVGDAVKALLQVGIGGDAVGHLAVVERLIGGHVEVAYAGIEQRRGLMFHVRAEIVLCLRHIGFVEIDLVGDVPVFHGVLLPFWLPSQGHSPAETSYRIHTPHHHGIDHIHEPRLQSSNRRFPHLVQQTRNDHNCKRITDRKEY